MFWDDILGRLGVSLVFSNHSLVHVIYCWFHAYKNSFRWNFWFLNYHLCCNYGLNLNF